MSTMLMDFDGRMQRAVQQQESRTLTTSISGQSKNRRGRNIRLASIVTLIVFLLVVVGVIIFLQAYNSLQQQYDHRLADMLRLTEEQVAADEAAQRDVLVISTKLGDIRVVLRPDLSAGSVDYVRTLVQSNKCDRCSFYRADGRGILQGIMKNKEIATNTELGACPPGYESVKNDCPAWDKNCSCHGPIMERGAVAWAAGQAGGPDFFIDNYRNPVEWWGTQHTNFGMIEDKTSLEVVDSIFDQPTKSSGGMTMLVDPIHFDLRLEKEG